MRSCVTLQFEHGHFWKNPSAVEAKENLSCISATEALESCRPSYRSVRFMFVDAVIRTGFRSGEQLNVQLRLMKGEQ